MWWKKAFGQEFTSWSSVDALKLLDYFVTSVSIIVGSVPGLPLAVKLSLAFAMEKLMGPRAVPFLLQAIFQNASAEVTLNLYRQINSNLFLLIIFS